MKLTLIFSLTTLVIGINQSVSASTVDTGRIAVMATQARSLAHNLADHFTVRMPNTRAAPPPTGMRAMAL